MKDVLTLIFLVFVSACSGGGEGGGSQQKLDFIPAGFPNPEIPSDNNLTPEKIELGRHLFYDVRLSLNQTTSCGSCHLQEKAFTDGRRLSIGSTGESHPRNSISIVNSAYQTTLNWANPLVTTLEQQLLIPLFSEHPVELGFAGHDDELVRRFQTDQNYIEMFKVSFPGESDPINLKNIAKAIASFERRIVSGNSAYDRFVYQGDQSAMSTSALRGMNLFFSERIECDHCHAGFNFSSPANHDGVAEKRSQFENNGLYNIGNDGSYPPNNTGLFEFTGVISDMGKFRPPSLRNVELTAPYMHDGSIATLEEVIDHYSRGGREIKSGIFKGDGKNSPFKSSLIFGFELSSQEKKDLVNFLKSLTDTDLISDGELSDPNVVVR